MPYSRLYHIKYSLRDYPFPSLQPRRGQNALLIVPDNGNGTEAFQHPHRVHICAIFALAVPLCRSFTSWHVLGVGALNLPSISSRLIVKLFRASTLESANGWDGYLTSWRCTPCGPGPCGGALCRSFVARPRGVGWGNSASGDRTGIRRQSIACV